MELRDLGQRYEVRFSGTGGQGVVLAGIILAEAASLQADQHVVQTVSYGPQVRGGLSSAEVVISGEEIDHPVPLGLDLLIPFTQEACDEGVTLMKPEGVILVDPDLVGQTPEGWVGAIPLSQLAQDATGRFQMVNIVALGAISALASCVTIEGMERATMERVPQGLEKAFSLALEVGFGAAEKIKGRITYERIPTPED
jgi:2-oxoglutarate ferredoxin oxidoreductase subunit gamma